MIIIILCVNIVDRAHPHRYVSLIMMEEWLPLISPAPMYTAQIVVALLTELVITVHPGHCHGTLLTVIGTTGYRTRNLNWSMNLW